MPAHSQNLVVPRGHSAVLVPNQYPAYNKVHSQSQQPYLTYPSSNSSLDQLHLSRTVLLKYLDPKLTLNELLSEISCGPIEYCKMFESPAPPHMEDMETVKTCYISFVSTAVAVNFHHKYGKNPYNLKALQDKLKNSRYLKISLNEPVHAASGASGHTNLSKQDYIKLKTLNYINDLNATRAVLLKFKIANTDLIPSTKEEIRTRCSKYGEIEDFRVSTNEEKHELKFLIHFTSIDTAIKIYEYHLKRIQIDRENHLDLGSEPLLMCLSVSFHRDRCDRQNSSKSRQPSTVSRLDSFSSSSSLSSSSPAMIRRKSANPLNITGLKINELNISPRGSFTATKPTDEDFPEEANEGSHPKSPTMGDPPTDVHRNTLEHSRSSEELESISSSSPSAATESLPAVYAQHYSASDPLLLYQTTPYQMAVPIQQGPQISVPSYQHAYQFNPDPFNVGNRTLYLGNLHPSTSVEEIANNVRAGGLVESFKYYKSKRICFITFVDAAVALKFYLNHQVLHQLIVHGSEVNVGWGKNHSGPLSREISLAVTAGASRNVYIGVRLAGDGEEAANTMRLPDEPTLRSAFGKFGDLEQINFYHNNDCGFMNFMNIVDAIKVVELFESENVDKINEIAGDNGEFYEHYRHFKISFGKDRCGNPPKFNYKKKINSVDFREPFGSHPTRASVGTRDEINPISEEAAMVFGISTDASHPAPALQSTLSDDSENDKNGSSGQKSMPVEDSLDGLYDQKAATNGKDNPTGDENKSVDADKKVSGTEEKLDEEIKCANVTSTESVFEEVHGGTEKNDIKSNTIDEPVKDVNVDPEHEDEDEDDDDDISIIIGSDVTTSSHKTKSKRSRRKHDKIYNHKFGLADIFDYNTSLNSVLSLSSTYGYPPPYNCPPANYGTGYPQAVFYPPESPYFVQAQPSSYYSVPLQSIPVSLMYPQVTNPILAMGSKGSYLASGSQVMAQYLARSQHENYVYAANILNNDVSVDDVKEYRKHGKCNTQKSTE